MVRLMAACAFWAARREEALTPGEAERGVAGVAGVCEEVTDEGGDVNGGNEDDGVPRACEAMESMLAGSCAWYIYIQVELLNDALLDTKS